MLKEELGNPSVHWAYLPYSMHMAGPREVPPLPNSSCPPPKRKAPCALEADQISISCYIPLYLR